MGRPGFKPGGWRQAPPGGFDSRAPPPVSCAPLLYAAPPRVRAATAHCFRVRFPPGSTKPNVERSPCCRGLCRFSRRLRWVVRGSLQSRFCHDDKPTTERDRSTRVHWLWLRHSRSRSGAPWPRGAIPACSPHANEHGRSVGGPCPRGFQRSGVRHSTPRAHREFPARVPIQILD